MCAIKKNIKQQKDYLSKKGYINISNFLDETISLQLYNTLKHDVNWGLACRINNETKLILDCSDVNKLSSDYQSSLINQIDEPFQFIYNTYMVVTSYLEQREPGHYLYEILEYLNSEKIKNYFRDLTDCQKISKVNAQATRYLPGHFLKQHNDENKAEGRLYAYVLNFTKNWNPDWGGILNLLDDKGDIKKAFIPKYNNLTIFKVPQNHYVSYVSPFAKKERLALTGWFLS